MIQARAFKEHYHHGITIFVEEKTEQGYHLALPIVLKKCEPDKMYEPLVPTLQLSMASGQKLIDDLWDCGLRPSEGSGSAGQLAATQRHLEDCRKLLSKVPLVKEDL